MSENARPDDMSATTPDLDLLVRYAYEAGSRGSWLEASWLWNELDRAYPSDSHRVMALETARLAGVLPMVDLSERVSVAGIIAVLGTDYSHHLLADVIRRSPSMSDEDLFELQQRYDPLPEEIRRSLIYAVLRSPHPTRLGDLGATAVPLLPISAAPATLRRSLKGASEVALPQLQSPFADVPRHAGDILASFRETTALRLEGAVLTSGSDAIEIDGSWYFDAASYPRSGMLDTTADPIVLAVSGEEVAVAASLPDAIDAKGGLWLAYPLTHAWGHFILECLTRLAILHATPERDEDNAFVTSAVPESFLEFARYIYPWVRFTRVDLGTKVRTDTCWVVPSRALTPGRIRWSAEGNHHANMDPYSLALLGLHMRESLAHHGDDAPMFAKQVYLDRTAATYRRSDSESAVRAIAESAGFHVVDPGTLSPAQEINLFVHAVDVAGFNGSQIVLTVAMSEPRRQLYFYHDESTEMRSLSYSLESCTGSRPSWILGSRASFIPGYSEQSIHQQILLSEDALSAASVWFEQP